MITWLGLQHKARLQMNVHCMIKGGMLPQILELFWGHLGAPVFAVLIYTYLQG